MAKIFTKLNIGDTVATSGTRVFKKLYTDLPIWNGTDLTGTTWNIQAGWSAEAGYDVFDVSGMEGSFNNFFGGITRNKYGTLRIGYYAESVGDTPYASANSLCWDSTDWETPLHARTNDTTKAHEFSFTGGTDVTNPRLIDWLLENGKLISHKYPIKGNWLFNETITETPIVCTDVEGLQYQSDITINFSYNGNTAVYGSLHTVENTNGDDYSKHLVYRHMLPNYVYDFVTASWVSENYRSVTFYDDTATNYNGEDVTPVFYKWLKANATNVS